MLSLFNWFSKNLSSTKIQAWKKKINAQISVNPHGDREQSRAAINAAIKILHAHNLKPQVNRFATEVEGSWNTIQSAISEIHQELHRQGLSKVSTDLHLCTKA